MLKDRQTTQQHEDNPLGYVVVGSAAIILGRPEQVTFLRDRRIRQR